jgi:hypothetical protein
MGKLLLNLKSRGWATTVLRESRVSAGGWPDFFVIGPGGRLGCISVSLEESDGDGGQLWNDAEMPGGLSNMAARLREVRESWRSTHPAEVTEPGLMILCPRFPGAALQRRWPALEQEGVLLAGREFCQGTRITEALERLSEDTPAELTVTLLRAFLAPETVLRPPLSPVERRRQAREHQLSLLPQLLDYDQDHCAKVDLWLSDEGRDAAENFGVRLVTGAAGTGKSVVLVHRAAMLRQFHPEARIAVLTHNQALRADLESRYQRMNGGGGVEFLTFQSWLSRRLCLREDVLDDGPRRGFIPASAFGTDFLEAEFDWIHDQGLQTLEEYLATPRTGRTIALREQARRTVYGLLEEYRARLKTAGMTDWSLRAWAALSRDLLGQRYDFILIDEAQFFAKVWFQLILRMLRPGGQLFLCADPAQGFLGRGQSWRSAGLELSKRSLVLKRPYRNTRQILSFAAARYEAYVCEDENAEQLQETNLTSLREGPEPLEITVETPQEEMAAVARQARQIVTGGAPAGDVMILCARRKQVAGVMERLAALGLPKLEIGELTPQRQEKITVGTIDKATGLERPIVLVCGMREFSNHERNPRLPEEERRRHRRLNASRIYMACTRAMERLVIVSCGGEVLAEAES